MIKDILRHEETLFKNSEVFDFDYIPEEFLFRQAQMQEIATCMKPAIQGRRPINCMLAGKPATGKTTSIKLILKQIQDYNHIIPVYINSRISKSGFRVFSEINKAVLGLSPPNTGIPLTSIYEKIFKNLKQQEKILITALDDAYYLDDTDELIYQLARANEIYQGIKIGIITVLSEKERYIIEDKSSSVFRPRVIEFPEYTKEEILEILKKRAELGLYPRVAPLEILNTIMSHVKNNDLRFGIELLRQSVIETESASEKTITKRHLETAFEKILKSEETGKHEIALTKNEKILLSLIEKPLISGQLFSLLNKKIKTSYSSFYRMIEKLEKTGLIQVKEKAQEEKKGRTRIIEKI